MKKLYIDLDLTLFDGGAAGGGGAAAGGEGAAAAGAEGGADAQAAGAAQETGAPSAEGSEPAQKTPEERRADYDKFVAEYRDLYDADRNADIEKAIKNRFRGAEKKTQAYDKLMPLMETFAGRYGVDVHNTDALIEAISNDNALYEDEAMQRGMNVDQLKQMKRLEAEVNMHRRAQQEQQRQAAAAQQYAAWEAEAAQVKQRYPGFDLRTELNSPETGERFRRLMAAGVGVKAAYEAMHHDEIVRGVATQAVQDTTNKVRNDIAARGQRPAEAGASGGGAVKTGKIDPAKLTNDQLRDISQRVMAGERITF